VARQGGAGVLTSDITVGKNADGRLELFVRGTDGALWRRWQTAPNGGWSNWASEGGVLTSNIAVAQNADGRLEVFVREPPVIVSSGLWPPNLAAFGWRRSSAERGKPTRRASSSWCSSS